MLAAVHEPTGRLAEIFDPSNKKNELKCRPKDPLRRLGLLNTANRKPKVWLWYVREITQCD